MLGLFKQKVLSKEYNLEEILNDVRNIIYANPNAALSQLRTFLEMLVNAALIYEGIGGENNRDLYSKIALLHNRGIFTNERMKMINGIRVIGNKSVHTYYSSKEEVLIYLQFCEELLESFQLSYESEQVKYKKKLIKDYKFDISNLNKKESKEYTLLNGERVIVPQENLEVTNFNQYEEIKEKFKYQLKILKKIYKELDIENKNIDIILDKIQKSTFNIVVLGEVNRGKSTLINSFLGQNILPSNILPTTSVITKVIYGDKSKAVVRFKSGEIKEISIENLKDYVTTIQKEGNKIIEYTEIHFPADICKNNCILVDTPGVNDINEVNSEVTYEYIPYADLIIFLIDPDQVFTKSERNFLKNRILDNNIKKIFFVLNKSDNINKETYKNLEGYIKDTLRELNLPIKYYLLSSKQALIGQIKEDINDYVLNFFKFKEDIKNFLLEEKGKFLINNTLIRIQILTKEAIEKINSIYELRKFKKKNLIKVKEDFLKKNDVILSHENNIFYNIDLEYDSLINKITDLVNIEMNKSFDSLIFKIKESNDLDLEKLGDLEGFINKSINNWIKVRINPILITELNKINCKLLELIKSNVKINNSQFVMDNSGCSNIVVFTGTDLDNCYTPIEYNNNNNTAFFSVGALITSIISGSIFAGVIVAAFAYFLTIQDDSNNITKDTVIIRIINKREEIIDNIKMKLIDEIHKNYENNKKYIKKQVSKSINENIKMISNLEKKLENSDKMDEELLETLNLKLKKLIIIYEQNKIFQERFNK